MRQATKDIISQYDLRDGITVAPDATAHGSSRVEVRDETGVLAWRAWEFEDGFEADLHKNLAYYAKK